MNRPIAISLSPNTEADDVLLAIKTLLTPWKWFDDNEVRKLEMDFASRYGGEYKALAVNSGRSALYLILKGLGIEEKDEVALQAFTCVVVPNQVLALGARPLFIDIDETYNLNPEDLSEKLSGKLKSVIVQHSFGSPARVNEIKKITQSVTQKIALIEDCAVSLGAKHEDGEVGTLGDVAFFSFGRDKVISSVFGGMILTSNKALYKKLKALRDELEEPTMFWTIQQLLHPVLFNFLILPLYNFPTKRYGLGKVALYLLQKVGLLSRAITAKEEFCVNPNLFPKKMPPALAILAKNQLKKVDEFNKKRSDVSKIYFDRLRDISGVKLPEEKEGSIWLRFPIEVENNDKVLNCVKNEGVLLGDWYSQVVTPIVSLDIVGYNKGSCPRAEKATDKIINLPTYPTMPEKDAEKVVYLIKKCLNTK